MILSKLLDLSTGSLALLGLGCGVIFYIVDYLLDPLRNIPGPVLARFTRWWYLMEIYKGSFELTDIKLHKKYGPIVRIAPHEYSVDDVEAAKTIYGHGSAFVKAPWYRAWMPPDPNKASLFSDRDPHRHAVQRRKFSSLYSMSSLVGYEPFVNNCTSMLTARFTELALAGQTINFQHWLQCYAFDVIGEITFANRFGFLDVGEDKEGVFKAIDQRGQYSTFIGVFPWLHQFLFPRLPTTGGHAFVYNYTLKQISDREKLLKDPKNPGREGPPDIMTKILLAHEENPSKITKLDLITMCQSNIGAGSDTTAITLSSILYHLLKYPQTYRTLQDEIDTAAKKGKISDPVTFKETQDHLPYLNAVIKEALRIHPATGLPMARLVPPTGATISNTFIPGGSTVGINAWVAHRNASIFGSDAAIFRPERWLEKEEEEEEEEAGEKRIEMEKYMLPFGMGSRTCIGKNISLLEMSKLIPQLVRRFDFSLDEREDLRCENRWFVKQMNFRGKVVLRDGGRLET